MVLKQFNDLPWYVQALLLVAVVGGVDFLLHYQFFQPIRQDIMKATQEIGRLSAEVEKGQAAERRLAEFDKEIKRNTEKLLILRSILPEEKETPEIVRRIQELAATSDLKIRKLTPQPSVGHGFYSDWPINIELDGSYDNLGRFFDRISKFTRIINVENLNIRGVQEIETPDKTLSATCTTKTFVFQEERKAVN
ncbi:MAG: type 4a pilus biogenesis protein PilO [Acidobacteria bacterium]|nr:type 4a pilus biogenesis protein PilO [Acidobacteriota bacterium]MBI3654889.1 type 4a pilus biogenesis protein PilO [Acidobacteriota bacterium]